MSKKEEWISVSEMAQRMGVSTQTIYNKVSKGEFKSRRFRRGRMAGILILLTSE